MEMSNGHLRLNQRISSRVVPIENVITEKPHSNLYISLFAINRRFLDIKCYICGHSCESVEAYE